MRLSQVTIQNFRSIANITIDFEPSCRVLVGINESGKTNILKALSLLDKDTVPENDDLRESLPDEPPITEGFVRFIFVLDKEERVKAYESVADKILGDTVNKQIVIVDGKPLSLAQYFDTKTTTLYRIELEDKVKRWAYYLDKTSEVISKWKKPSKTSLSSITLEDNASPVRLNTFSIVHAGDVDESLLEELDDLSISDLNAIVNKAIHEVVKDKLPQCILWEYSEENILPGQIDIAAFSTNPESCMPMKYMFALAGHPDAKTAIEEAQNRPNGLRNLLKRVSELSTKHMHAVWKDYRGIRLELVQNGEKIDAHVEDAYNVYNLSRRSDGFKRFVTFLLLVSAKVKTKELQNTLYLHDEPDVSLHPSGARYLRDELIKISSNNYVVYSTHSIFMIDRNIINRHLIVEKKNEVTTISEVNESNIVDEEVIYNALGYSIFENLKAKNIIFEGWRDKKLFQFGIEKLPSSHKSLKKPLLEIGICHAKGVKDISHISPMLELAGRECLILSDGDKVAIEHQRDYKGYGTWIRYDELIEDELIVTAEDFIKPEAFQPFIKRSRSENPSLPELLREDLEKSKGRLIIIQSWLEGNGIDKATTKIMLNNLKDELISNLKSSHLEPKYFDLLDGLAKKL